MSSPQDHTRPTIDAPDPSVPLARPVESAARAHHPLGPLYHWEPLDGAFAGRAYAAGVLVAAVAILAVAARLQPAGLCEGVHQQLGLPPCGFVVMTGLPCPTCGMTTAFAHTVRGQWLQAAESQIAGLLLAAATIITAILAAAAIVTGRRPALNWYRINPVRLVWIGCGLFVVAWGVKIVFFLLEHGSRR